MEKITKFLFSWLPAFVVMIVIFYFSSLSGPKLNSMGLSKESYHFDGHFFLFLFLCASYYRATKKFLTSILLTLIYAFLDETHQLFIPYRGSSYYDLFVDTLGALVASGGIWILLPKIPKKLKKLLFN